MDQSVQVGDVLTLIEKAEAAFDEETAKAAAEKLMTTSFTLEDFLDQFQQVRRMGPLGDLLGMLPGAATAFGDAQVAEADLVINVPILKAKRTKVNGWKDAVDFALADHFCGLGTGDAGLAGDGGGPEGNVGRQHVVGAGVERAHVVAEIGIGAILMKPVSKEDLAKTVRKVLDDAGALRG